MPNSGEHVLELDQDIEIRASAIRWRSPHFEYAPGFWLSGDGAPFRISAIGLDTAPPGR